MNLLDLTPQKSTTTLIVIGWCVLNAGLALLTPFSAKLWVGVCVSSAIGAVFILLPGAIATVSLRRQRGLSDRAAARLVSALGWIVLGLQTVIVAGTAVR